MEYAIQLIEKYGLVIGGFSIRSVQERESFYGTSKVGTLVAPISVLTRLFGEPHSDQHNKLPCWHLFFDIPHPLEKGKLADSVAITIYGHHREYPYEWGIGAFQGVKPLPTPGQMRGFTHEEQLASEWAFDIFHAITTAALTDAVVGA